MTIPHPDIAVVIPAFRAKRFISHAIESALSQSDVSVEVLVIDDCCPEETAAEVENRFLGEPRVKVIRLPENGGPAKARNAGIAHAKADWVAVLDADDIFEAGRLARLLAAARVNNADVIADNVRFLDVANDRISEPLPFSDQSETMLTIYTFVGNAHPGVSGLDLGLLKPMFRKEFLREKDLSYPEAIRHGEDFTFYYRIIRAGGRFFVTKQAGYRWTLRNSGNSQTVEDYPGQRFQALCLANEEKDDPLLRKLLKRRARELMRLYYNRKVALAKSRGSIIEEVSLVLWHPRFSVPRYAKAACRRLF